MNRKQLPKLGVEHATHTLTILFGLTSLANVNAFLRGAGHDPYAAAVLSLALGAALIVVSIALTQIDWQTERPAFASLTTVALALGLISGALQSAQYSLHLPGAWPYLLGYGIPLIGEVGLSLAAALFTKAQRRSELRGVNAKLEQAIITNLDAAIASFDPTPIQRRIDRSLNTVAARAVDGVTGELMRFYSAPLAEPVEASPAETAAISPNVPELTLANAVRLSKKNANVDKALALIQAGQHSLGDLADAVGVSSKTIGRYIDHLRTSGHNITVNDVVTLA